MAKQALPGRRANMFMMNPSDLVIVGLDTDDGIEHPLYDERIKLPVDQRLVTSIAMMGVSDPVLVRKDGDVPVVVDGRQRVRAAREVNEKLVAAGKPPVSIPVTTMRGDELLATQLGEHRNNIRQEDPVVLKASKARRYVNMGLSLAQIAAMQGVSKVTVSNWLKLDEAHPDVKAAVKSEAMGLVEAVKASSKPREEQKKVAKKATEARAAGAPAKKRGRPAGGGMSRKRAMKLVVDAAEAAGKKKMLVHPEFLRGLQFALEQISEKEAGVDGIIAAATKPKKGAKKDK